MPREAKLNAVAVCFLAALFYWLFMFSKHNLYLRYVIPFGDDPYDAVGSFACVAGAPLAFVALVRAYYPYRSGPDRLQMLYLVRSQLAVVLAVFMTAAADVTAMVRYPRQWLPSFWGYAVSAVVAVPVVSAGAIFLLLRPSLPAKTEARRGRMLRALLATLAGMLLLAASPRSMLGSMASHLLVIMMGAAVLFASMRLWLAALAPDEVWEDNVEQHPVRMVSAWRRRAGVVVLGALIGLCAFAGELAEHRTGLPMRKLLFVGSVYSGIGLSGILMAYLFLGEPLGFAARY
ncbi:MAG TPA: hypothetical protein VME86_04655 [Acidobacteriaceae bacterium]|nr:hypothetical protein [Acidobacteriaceae bacterium]